jgi:adenine-specific DNA methylase
MANFRYPSTRYAGSKLRLLDWIWENIKDIKFKSALDLFGGTGSVSLLFKKHGKQVMYNDVLKFNQTIGLAIIENNEYKVSDNDMLKVLNFNGKKYPDFIQKEFKDIFFLPEENAWLDKVVSNIYRVRNKYKRAILFASLFQACLSKRPFNLFHRANLYIRTNNVSRTFGNKTTWEKPFEVLFRKYISEYNQAVFDNGEKNKVIGGHDALSAPNGVDLVYLDPPYFSTSSNSGMNYLVYYHFLEGMVNYRKWKKNITYSGKIKRLKDTQEILQWTRKSHIYESFKRLLERFQDSIIVLSYQSNGVPSKGEIIDILTSFKKRVKVKTRPHRYVLSPRKSEELLFIAR